jgi:hypothetical protein
MKDTKETSVVITNAGLPRQNDSFADKIKAEWGLKVGKAISYQWFKKDNGGTSKFYSERAEVVRRRAYAQGIQDISKYKEAIKLNGDMSYTNLNFTPVPIIPKYVDIVTNGLTEKEYSIRAFSIDPISTKNRISYRQRIERDMMAKDFLLNAKEQLGVSAFNTDPNNLPETNEELDIHMQLNYKPSIELSNQLAIQTIFNENKFNLTTKKRFTKDLVIAGIGAVKHRFVKSEGIRLEYVDVADLVYSYTKDPYFSDCYYFGEFKNSLISEVYRDYPGLTDEERERIQNIGNAWNKYHNLNEDDTNDAFRDKVGLLYFNYKTTRQKVWKEKNTRVGGKKVLERDETLNPSKDGLYNVLKKEEEVWFEGVMVLGTEILLKWEVAKNMVRPKSNTNKVMPNYVVCAPLLHETGHIDSLVNRMIPFGDEIQIVNLQIQRVLQQMRPDGHEIDIEGIANISLGNGNKYDHTEAINMFMQTGSILTRGTGVGGEFNGSKRVVQEIPSTGFNNKLAALINQYQFKLQMIRDVTGVNEARDGSTPDRDSLVGIQKMAAANSNLATRHLQDAIFFIIREIAECTSYRVSDVLEYSPLKEDLINKIGNTAVVDLNDINDLHLRDFGIFIDLDLDDEQKAKLESDLSLEIQAGTLGVEDKFSILNIRDYSLAYRVLAIAKKKKAKQRQEDEMAKIKANQDSQIQISQAASQAKAQQAQMEGQIKMQIQQAVNQGEIAKLETEARLKSDLMEREFNYQMQIKQKETDVLNQRDMLKEDRKDDRTKLQATQQSELIDQRKKDKMPIDFESDGMDGLDGFRI